MNMSPTKVERKVKSFRERLESLEMALANNFITESEYSEKVKDYMDNTVNPFCQRHSINF